MPLLLQNKNFVVNKTKVGASERIWKEKDKKCAHIDTCQERNWHINCKLVFSSDWWGFYTFCYFILREQLAHAQKDVIKKNPSVGVSMEWSTHTQTSGATPFFSLFSRLLGIFKREKEKRICVLIKLTTKRVACWSYSSCHVPCNVRLVFGYFYVNFWPLHTQKLKNEIKILLTELGTLLMSFTLSLKRCHSYLLWSLVTNDDSLKESYKYATSGEMTHLFHHFLPGIFFACSAYSASEH